MTTPIPPASVPLARKVTLLFIATLTIMAGTTVAPALPAIETAFGSLKHVELMSRMVLTLPSIFVAMFAPIAGILADRFGRKKLLIAAIVLYGLAGVSGLFVDSLVALLVGRAGLGLAMGAIMTIGTALVGDYFDGQERHRYLGLQQAFTQLGGVVFVVGGGLLADLHWRAPFAVYGVAVLILPAAMLFLSEAVRKGLPSVTDIAAPVERPNLASIALICLVAFLINASFYTIPSQLPFHLRALGLGQSSIAGLAIGIFNLAAASTALSYGRLRARFDLVAIFALGLALMALGFWCLAAASTLVGVLLAMVIMGLGLGFVIPNIMSAAIAIATPGSRGRVAGLVTASMFLGHFASPFASQPWISRFGYSNTYRDLGMLLAAMCLAAVVGTIARHRRQTADASP